MKISLVALNWRRWISDIMLKKITQVKYDKNWSEPFSLLNWKILPLYTVYINYNNYKNWASSVRRQLLSTISISSGLSTDYEMSRRLRLKLKIKSCEDLIRLALFYSNSDSPNTNSNTNSTERAAFAALLVEQTDLNRYSFILCTCIGS